jgi:hypothetical protein
VLLLLAPVSSEKNGPDRGKIENFFAPGVHLVGAAHAEKTRDPYGFDTGLVKLTGGDTPGQ